MRGPQGGCGIGSGAECMCQEPGWAIWTVLPRDCCRCKAWVLLRTKLLQETLCCRLLLPRDGYTLHWAEQWWTTSHSVAEERETAVVPYSMREKNSVPNFLCRGPTMLCCHWMLAWEGAPSGGKTFCMPFEEPSISGERPLYCLHSLPTLVRLCWLSGNLDPFLLGELSHSTLDYKKLLFKNASPKVLKCNLVRDFRP